MIDKKKLINELLKCVEDATDIDTQITSLTMAGVLMNEVVEEALNIAPVVGTLKCTNCENGEVELVKQCCSCGKEY